MFTKGELNNVIRKSGKKTTPGNDQISYCMIKNLNDKTKDILLQLYKVWEVE